MRNLANNAEYVWSKEKFRNNLYLMQEMYANFEDEDDWDLPEVRQCPGIRRKRGNNAPLAAWWISIQI